MLPSSIRLRIILRQNVFLAIKPCFHVACPLLTRRRLARTRLFLHWALTLAPHVYDGACQLELVFANAACLSQHVHATHIMALLETGSQISGCLNGSEKNG